MAVPFPYFSLRQRPSRRKSSARHWAPSTTVSGMPSAFWGFREAQKPQKADGIPGGGRSRPEAVVEGHLRLAHSLREMVEVVAVRQEGAELPVVGGGQAQGVSLRDGPQDLAGGGDPLHGVGATQDLVYHAEKGRGALRGIQNTL